MQTKPRLNPDELLNIARQCAAEATNRSILHKSDKKGDDLEGRKQDLFDVLFSEAYTAALEAVERADESVADIAAYVATAARNGIKRHFSGRRRDRHKTNRERIERPAPSIPEPDDRLANALRIASESPEAAFDVVTRHLTNPQREALWLRYGENLSLEEVGEKLGLTKTGAQYRIETALAACRPNES